MHEGGGRWVGSNKLIELKKNELFTDDSAPFLYPGDS